MLIAIPAAALTVATLLLGALWLLIASALKRRRPGAWWRLLRWHALLLLLHAFVTLPVGLAAIAPWFVDTRGDERSYAGPRFAADGTWELQSRESLAQERAARSAGAPLAERSPYEVAVQARDGATLRGFHVLPKTGAPRFQALLVHGLFRGALELETAASMLRELGGEVLLLELRRHGGSERRRFTYGRDEVDDVLGGVDWLRGDRARGDRASSERSDRGDGQRGDDSAPATASDPTREPPLLLFAVSIGTAAAARAAPQIERLAALVLDAPMDDLRATAERMLAGGEGRGGAIAEPFRWILLSAGQLLGTLPFDEVRPAESLRALDPQVRVLLIGAGDDTRMPPVSVESLFAALPTAADRKQLWICPGAKHGHVWSHDPATYRARLAALTLHL
ncbi:MAG: hypothetical protein JNL90_00080 [Planctomycetes bacterium]|nr:hypothetical protein [Planctomycetota bacterium]